MAARAGLTVDAVVVRAAELADAGGLDRLTVSSLARSLGVKDASLYAHVRSLKDLRTRIALLAAEEMADRIALAVAGRTGREALTAFADAYRAYALERPGRYAATQARLDPAEVAGQRGFERSAHLTRAVLRGYLLDEPGLTDAGRLLRGTFHGFVALEAAGGFAHEREVAASWRQAVLALHVALANWPHTGAEPAESGAAGPGTPSTTYNE